jgi:hypothetical protein
MLHLGWKELVMNAYLRTGSLALVGALAGAAYVFVPATQPGTSRIAMSRVPPEAPTGRIELASFGVTELTPESMPPMQTLHVRVTLANFGDDEPLVFDARTTRLELGDIVRAPLFANSEYPALPVMAAPRFRNRVVDLYFGLPTTVQRDEDISKFSVAWSVTTGARRVTGRDHFDGLAEAARTTRPVDTVGLGAHWWADPTYPWPLYWHRPGPIRHRPPEYVTVTRRPLGELEDPAPCDQW